MDLKKYDILLKSIDYGSFSRVAEELDYTPSAISHMMNNLDKEFGFPLLIRSYSGVKPTENCLHIQGVQLEVSYHVLYIINKFSRCGGGFFQ